MLINSTVTFLDNKKEVVCPKISEVELYTVFISLKTCISYM